MRAEVAGGRTMNGEVERPILCAHPILCSSLAVAYLFLCRTLFLFRDIINPFNPPFFARAEGLPFCRCENKYYVHVDWEYSVIDGHRHQVTPHLMLSPSQTHRKMPPKRYENSLNRWLVFLRHWIIKLKCVRRLHRIDWVAIRHDSSNRS